jgi:hypothetical protein
MVQDRQAATTRQGFSPAKTTIEGFNDSGRSCSSTLVFYDRDRTSLSRKEREMLTVVLPARTTFATVASFPPKYFLENLIVRTDNSVLITAMNKKEVWYVPPIVGTKPVEPVLLHTFDELVISFTELEGDVFSLVTSNVYTDHQSRLYRIDLRSWKPGEPITPQKVLDFPEEARALNGSCLLDDRTLLVADSVAGLIWRVNLLDGAPRRLYRYGWRRKA